MKGTDLRIGNLIYDFGDGEGQVLAIDKDGYVLTTANDVPQPAETFTGIPLTEEWLKDFGFKYTGGFEDRYVNEVLKIYGSPLRKGWTIENIEPNFDIEYVHQLQNLVFVLIGTELTIKP